MPDGTIHSQFVDDAVDFTLRVACECYCSIDLIRDAVGQQPMLNGSLAWDRPVVPGESQAPSDADLVLIVADESSLKAALQRSLCYQRQESHGASHILIYLQDTEEVSAEAISGLVLPRTQCAAGIASLVRTLFEPVIPQGLICVDWCDTRHVLETVGQILISEASGKRFEDVVELALAPLRDGATGRPINGLQASILCSPGKLSMARIAQLSRACNDVSGEDATSILAAPGMNWPELDYYEVRLFAKVECG